MKSKRGRPKGGKNRKWTQEEKRKAVSRHLDDYEFMSSIAKDLKMSTGMLSNWVKRYHEEGEEGLRDRKKGNPYAAIHTKKNLSEVEELRLALMKKEIEIERLKKGYEVKGVGANKVYVILNEKNIK